jgi:hypothetical protein
MSAPRNSDHLAQILRELPEPLLSAFGELPLPMWIVDQLGHCLFRDAQPRRQVRNPRPFQIDVREKSGVRTPQLRSALDCGNAANGLLVEQTSGFEQELQRTRALLSLERAAIGSVLRMLRDGSLAGRSSTH